MFVNKIKPIRKEFLSSIPEIPELPDSIKSKSMSHLSKGWKFIESYWYIIVSFFGMLLVYAMARIISLQRRVRDLESRPPVDEITLRGAVRLQLNDLVADLEQNLRAKHSQTSDYFQTDTLKKLQSPSNISNDLQNSNESKKLLTQQQPLDDEINEVFKIANSVKESLPDLKLFANAIKNQKLEKLKLEKVEKSNEIQEINNQNQTELKPDVFSNANINLNESNKNNESVIPSAISIIKSEEKLELQSDSNKDTHSNLVKIEKEIYNNDSEQLENHHENQEQEIRWSTPKKKVKVIKSSVRTKKKMIEKENFENDE